MEFNLTVPQTEFHDSQTKYTAAVAGFGSGKTDGALSKMISNMMEAPASIKLRQGYLAPTYSLIQDIFYPKIEEFLVTMGFIPNKDFGINRSKHIIEIRELGTILCRTMDKPENIVGWEVADIFLDEFDLLPTKKALTAFRKASSRMRQKNPVRRNQLFITTTPEGFKATYELFEKTPVPDSQIIRMSTYSNAHNLPHDYIDSLREQYPPQLIEAYLEGKFVNLVSGSVYPSFDRELNSTHFTARPREPLYIGMDFNVYKMYAGIHIIRDGIPYLVDEFSGVKDTPTMADLINETFEGHTITVYPDATGDNKSSKGASLSDLSILRDAGFNIDAPNKNPLIRNRVNAVNAKFCNTNGERSYYVNTERCPVATMAFEQQIYDDSGMPDKKNDFDHPNDANGYFIHRNWPLTANISHTIYANDIAQEFNYDV